MRIDDFEGCNHLIDIFVGGGGGGWMEEVGFLF